MSAGHRFFVLSAAALLLGACAFSPTSPFEGFDGKGSRVSGSFDSGVAAQSEGASAAGPAFQGIQVTLQGNSSLSTTVGADGTFTLVGVPAGSFTLVFLRDGRVIGEIRFHNVGNNQEITIVVSLLSDGEVVLLEEHRDHVSFEGSCPRGAGFWCQSQDGKNPNLSQAEFKTFAGEAATLLSSVDALNSADEIAAAVCNTGDQLLRQLATLALNLVATPLDSTTPLKNEPQYSTVGATFDAAVAVANNPAASTQVRNEIKDVLERINGNQNTDVCEPTDDDDNPPTGKITICHVPPGNPGNRHTITIDASAWPAHQAHGDTMGSCH